MSERIDHVAEAKAHLDEAADYPPDSADWAGVRTQCAQAHATLALVEQQRAANRIALAEIAFDTGDGGKVRITRGLIDFQRPEGGLLEVKMDPEIAAALGLDQ